VQQLQQTKNLREAMQSQLASMLAPETSAKKALADHENKLGQLEAVKYERSNNFWKTLLAAPIVNAFGSDIRPEQIWLPDLTMTNGSFGKVARFDRCVTCHTGITKTAAGSATEPAFPEEKAFTVTIDLAELPKELRDTIPALRAKDTSLAAVNSQLQQTYGFALAETGLFAVNDPTISIIYPGSLAAKAGLSMGDVIRRVGTTSADPAKASPITTRSAAEVALLSNPDWKRAEGAIPVTITVQRGVPQPYCSHPRMDLFVSDSSPHPAGKFGCTICHQGQGSGTSFQNSSHTPNSVIQEEKWASKYGWFFNHHWIEPMLPTRFDQASCLKCHFSVVELEPSTRFPDPPAAKLVHGYETIREYGCFGCHEINGYDGPSKRIGPDMRVEPQYFAAAEQLLADPGFKKLGPAAVKLAETVSAHPHDNTARRELMAVVLRDQELTDKGKNPAGAPVLQPDSYRMAAVLKDVETPGDMRKVGPSLRHVSHKVGYKFLYDWLRNPKDFRPTTKMPRFFGLYDHLSGEVLERTKKYEAIEVRGITEYLLNASQPYERIKPAEGVAAATFERGKKVFETRGCLACHAHDDFPQSHAHQGPNLSRIGEKLALDNPTEGAKWLYSWVREPNRYHNRTVMPNVFLEPYPVNKMENGKEVRDADNKPIVEQMIDPAADVVAYLMKPGAHPWQPAEAIPAQQDLPKVSTPAELATFVKEGYAQSKLTDLEALAYEDLAGKYTKARATEILEKGIVKDARGDELALAGVTPENRAAKLLEYVGRRSISKYGCFGCHDIPGYEDGKAIGAALADWGRKDPAKLAFENIGAYVHEVLEHGHGGGHGKASNGHGHDAAAHGDAHAEKPKPTTEPLALTEAAANPEESASAIEMGKKYLLEKLNMHEREGFLWNKLSRPRSYDYMKSEKPHKDRLRMPKFTFAQDDKKQEETIEAVMTFVLGLVSDPPPGQYVYKPDARQEKIIAGRKLLEKYNCGGCHTLGLERLDLVFKPGTDELQIPSADHQFFPFQEVSAKPEQAAASTKTDRSGRERATLLGMFSRDKETGKIAVYNEDDELVEDPATVPAGTKFKYNFNLYEPAIVDGKAVPVTPRSFILTDAMMAKKGPGEKTVRYWPAQGGDLTKILFPVVLKDAVTKPGNPAEAYGWLPPPLFNEGRKVQTKWLHDFLLDPKPIRPAAVLRMPKFNMSSAEAQTFAEYFAAADNAAYPYEVNPQQSEAYLAEAAKAYPQRMDVAMKIITSSSGCVKCHVIGDYSPGGDPKALGPQLSEVHQRLRPDYVKSWIANPHSHLPYTAMLRVIEATKPSAAGAFDPNATKLEKKPGESDEDFAKRQDAAKLQEAELQLQAVTDYFTNFDRILKDHYQFSKEVPPPMPGAENPPAGANPGSE
jgi:cytochrome c2